MINPVGYRLLVKPDPINEQTDWGFEIVTNERDKRLEKAAQTCGVIVAVGDDCWADSPKKWASVGDKVSYAKNGGMFIRDPDTDEEYVLLNDEDITAILTKSE